MFADMENSYTENKTVVSNDGSHTLFSERFGETYHSSFGAIQESKHIFMDAALNVAAGGLNPVNIFEVGFGTGLNALMALKFAMDNHVNTTYVAVEAFPVLPAVIEQLNYPLLLKVDRKIYTTMHESKGSFIEVTPFFSLKVVESTLQDYELKEAFFDVVFFDAFSPESQPEMWKQSCFEKIFNGMRAGGVLTTYSSKGIVKRALKSAGFSVEKLPGPPGKREFVRAMKNGSSLKQDK